MRDWEVWSSGCDNGGWCRGFKDAIVGEEVVRVQDLC